MEKSTLDIVKEMTCKIKEATKEITECDEEEEVEVEEEEEDLEVEECEIEDDEELNESKKKTTKWIPNKMKKGALHKKLGIPEDEKIPMSLINKEIKRLQKEAEGDKKLSDEDATLLKELLLAKTFKKMNK